MIYPPSIEKLCGQFRKLPGIGQKSAIRLALFVLKMSKEDASSFAESILEVKRSVGTCSVCHGITESDPCSICSDLSRNRAMVCVVEESTDLFAIENTNGYKGLYHVLKGAISPLNGIHPDDLTIDDLVKRLETSSFTEVVMATGSNMEGETTALYIGKLLQPFDIKVTRIARGIPVGGDLEHADPMTITRGMDGRTLLGV